MFALLVMYVQKFLIKPCKRYLSVHLFCLFIVFVVVFLLFFFGGGLPASISKSACQHDFSTLTLLAFWLDHPSDD